MGTGPDGVDNEDGDGAGADVEGGIDIQRLMGMGEFTDLQSESPFVFCY